MANFIIRYKLIESTDGGSKRKSYTSNVHIISDSLEEAKEIVTDSFVNTEEITYDITFL